MPMHAASPDLPDIFAAQHPVRLGTCLERAFRLYTREWGWFAGWGLAVAALQAALGVATAGWAILLGLALIVPTKLGLYAIAAAAAEGRPVSLATLAEGYKRPAAWALGLLETGLLVLGTLALILPGVLVAFGLTWTAAALYRRNLSAVEAVGMSFRLARRHPGLTLGVTLVGFAFDAVGTGTVLLGCLTLPMMTCLKTVAFEQLDPKLDLFS